MTSQQQELTCNISLPTSSIILASLNILKTMTSPTTLTSWLSLTKAICSRLTNFRVVRNIQNDCRQKYLVMLRWIPLMTTSCFKETQRALRRPTSTTEKQREASRFFPVQEEMVSTTSLKHSPARSSSCESVHTYPTFAFDAIRIT